MDQRKTMVAIEVIATYEQELLLDGEPCMQSMFNIDVPLGSDGHLAEAEVLFHILEVMEAAERQQLCKLSICLKTSAAGEAERIAPWLFCQDSPLFNGKLWLKQHLWSGAEAASVK